MLRSWLEENCWLQGRFVSNEDLELLKDKFVEIPKDNIYLILASQSCDACASEEKEEFVEFSIAKAIEQVDGNFMYNKNPRRLHIEAEVDGSEEGFEKLNLELMAQDKIKIRKTDIKLIKEIKPHKNIVLTDSTVSQYANWLASRYNRPALPSSFERRLDNKSKKKADKKLKTISKHIVGIYVDIFPDEEISDDEVYNVDLLFLITNAAKNDSEILQDIQTLSNEYKQSMISANFEVGEVIIGTKKEISIATLESHKRLIYDNLSYKNNEPIPPNI